MTTQTDPAIQPSRSWRRRSARRSLPALMLGVALIVTAAAPIASEEPAATPSGEPSPAATVTPIECTDEDIIGAGRGTTGGAGGHSVEVQTPREFLQAIEIGKRPLTVRIDAPEAAVWTLGRVNIDEGDLTVEGSPDIVFRGTQLLIHSSNVILRHLYSGTGDETLDRADAEDFEPFTINGFRGPVSHIVLQCVVGIWGPDIGGLAILGDATDVTVQDSIFGEGLYFSKHPEATVELEGHSHGLNVTRGEPEFMLERITVARNLITRSEGRMPKVTGGRQIELTNNLIIGWGSRAPEGNAESINVMGNYLIPSSNSTELLVWSPRAQGADPKFYRDSVWLAGNLLEGYGGDELRGRPKRVYRDDPAFPSTYEPMTAEEARDHVIAVAGGLDRPAWAQRVIDDALSGVSDWYNGEGHDEPRPRW